jgi:hypothetical protein
MFILHFTIDIAKVIRCISHMRYRHQINLHKLLDIPLDLGNNTLGRSQVTGTQNNKLAFTINTKFIHLAVGADIIHPGVGAGIRNKDKTGIN